MSDTITVYYYTAWDGFAWQGCDEATAKSLQGYMEATKTLPKSSADEPPFGGAVPCKIAGQIGVAVYRYMTREKGDLSGRDCLYIALAFIPLDVGCVDFSKLLELPQLNKTQKGELRPQYVSVSEHGLRMDCKSEVPDVWLDTEIVGTPYATLRGRDGLLTLSRLFFSTHTQLGFLTAVFRLEAGNTIVSNQTYSVYREVLKVAAASEELRHARTLATGVLPSDHKAIVEMKSALCELDEWASKQRGYPGLKAYHDEKKLEMSDDGDRIKEISRYSERLNRAWDAIRDVDTSENGYMDGNARYAAEHCLALAKEIKSLPIIEHESYRDALKLSLEATCHSVELLEAMSNLERLTRAEEAQNEVERKLTEVREELKKAKSEASGVRVWLGKKEEELQRLKGKLSGKGVLHECNTLVMRPKGAAKRTWLSSITLNRILAVVAIVTGLLVSGMAIMLVKNAILGGRHKKVEVKVATDPVGSGEHDTKRSTSSNAVPDQVVADVEVSKVQNPSNTVDLAACAERCQKQEINSGNMAKQEDKSGGKRLSEEGKNKASLKDTHQTAVDADNATKDLVKEGKK